VITPVTARSRPVASSEWYMTRTLVRPPVVPIGWMRMRSPGFPFGSGSGTR
jgi:hypothetical protein